MTSTTTKDLDWRDVLREAASIVEEGWCQGALHLNKDGEECYREDAVQSCATGAIQRALDHLADGIGPGAVHIVVYRLQKILLGRLQINTNIPKWNDHPDRTAAEVAETMRQAAKS